MGNQEFRRSKAVLGEWVLVLLEVLEGGVKEMEREASCIYRGSGEDGWQGEELSFSAAERGHR